MNPFIIDNFEALKSIEAAWNELFTLTPDATCFQSFQSNYAWIHQQKKRFKPMILCYGSKKRIETLIPTCFDKHRKRLVFMQQGNVDILDLLWNPESNLYTNISKILKELNKINPNPTIYLTNLRKSSPLVELLPTIYQKKPFFLCQHDLYSRLIIDKIDFERFLNHIPSKSYIRLKKVDASIPSVGEVRQFPQSFPSDLIATLLKKMEQANIREKQSYENILPLMKDLYQNNDLFFMVQSIDDKILSMTALIQLTPSEIMGWIDFYDPNIKRVNIKNYLHILRYCKKHTMSFNLGTGLYEYKMQNFHPEIHTLFSFTFSHSSLGFLRIFGKRVIAKAMGYL